MTRLIDRITTTLADAGYVVEREIGAGGMARVFLCHREPGGEQYAVKVLRPELASVLAWDRFQREVAVAADLRHPGIVPFVTSGMSDGIAYAVFEFEPGGSVRDEIDGGPVGMDRAVDVVAQVARALSHAHASGIVHRDVKPENLLRAGSRVILADLGLARAVGRAAGDRLTETGIILGTPAYMSPEQATGSAEIGPASDIYSLGVVFHELLTGRQLFGGRSSDEVIRMRFRADAPAVESLPGSPGGAVREAYSRMVRLRPADRFPSARELTDYLESNLEI